jgi:hypothetical protein
MVVFASFLERDRSIHVFYNSHYWFQAGADAEEAGRGFCTVLSPFDYLENGSRAGFYYFYHLENSHRSKR